MPVGTLVTPAAQPTIGVAEAPRGGDHRKVGKAVALAGAADYTTSYVAAGTSSYVAMVGYAAFAIACRLVSGTAPTSVELTLLWSDDMASTPVDFQSVNDATSGGTTTLTAGEISLTWAAQNAFVTRPIQAAGRFLKVKAKRTGGAADTRVEVAIWPISHIG